MGTKESILIVEDDKHIAKLIRYNLEKEGYDCSLVITGEDALETLETAPIDLIVLDVMLPKMDGFEVCKRIRQDKSVSHIPIIMLTARGEEVDRIVGLELGADDYMIKPFSPRELILRIKSILRRGIHKEDAEQDVLSADCILVNIPRHTVKVDGEKVNLTPMEFKLLTTMLKRKGRVQSRDILLDKVWGISADVTTRTVDTHIKLLRQKLGSAGKLIETVRGLGYKINDDE
ncbi:MAG: response regulator transcription factor [Candidatus Omnitrophota bacterium]